MIDFVNRRDFIKLAGIGVPGFRVSLGGERKRTPAGKRFVLFCSVIRYPLGF